MTKPEQTIVQRALWESARVVATRAGADATDFFADDAAADEHTSAILRVARRLAAPTVSATDDAEATRLTRALATIERGASYANDEQRPAERQRSRGASSYPLTEPALDETFLFNDETPSSGPSSGGHEAGNEAVSDDYRVLWEGLRRALSEAAGGECEAWLAALKRYTWAVPAAGGVSLYEQARTTAALAVSLHRADWDAAALADYEAALDESPPANNAAALQRPVAWLVKGDLSGVQDFLYLLTSAGAARGLRGRSFYLQLLTETLAAWVLREVGDLPSVNVLYAGGGHFYLLLPAPITDSRWDELRQRLATTLWQAHAGDLGCTLARVPLNAHDLLTAGELAERWQALGEISSSLKQRKWLELGNVTMFERLFEPQDHGTTPEKMCQVCQHEWDASRDELRDEIRKCSRCFGFEELGKQLREVKHLVRFAVAPQPLTQVVNWQTILAAFGAHVELVAGDAPAPALPAGGVESVVVERIWAEKSMPDWHSAERECFDWTGVTASYGWRLLAQATPSKTDENGATVVAEFSDLAEAADGAHWLGVLRMDVDDLGEVLRAGLQGHAALARLSTLSETLRLFFEGWVPQLCARYNGGSKGHQVYLIYAGGDDLFVVGAWSALPQLARQIRDDFARFVGGQHITVSAGIAIEHAKYPLYQLAETAGHALDAGAKGLRPEKDALQFLGQGVGWDEFKQVENWHRRLRQMLENGMPRSLLTRLSEIHASYVENAQKQYALAAATGTGGISTSQIKEQIQYARWQWRLVYQLSQARERNKTHEAELSALQEALVRDDRFIGLLRVLARWTELQTRNPQTNE